MNIIISSDLQSQRWKDAHHIFIHSKEEHIFIDENERAYLFQKYIR